MTAPISFTTTKITESTDIVAESQIDTQLGIIPPAPLPGQSITTDISQMYAVIVSGSANIQYNVGDANDSSVALIIKNKCINATLSITPSAPYLIFYTKTPTPASTGSGFFPIIPPQLDTATIDIGPQEELTLYTRFNVDAIETAIQHRKYVNDNSISLSVVPINFVGDIIIQNVVPQPPVVILPPVVDNSSIQMKLTIQGPASLRVGESAQFEVVGTYGTQTELDAGLGKKMVFGLGNVIWSSNQPNNIRVTNYSTGARVTTLGLLPGNAKITATIFNKPSNITQSVWNQLRNTPTIQGLLDKIRAADITNLNTAIAPIIIQKDIVVDDKLGVSKPLIS